MRAGFTDDPNVALTGLLCIALLGVLVMCGGLMIGGVMEGAWLQIASGALLLGYLSWMVWQAARVVRRSLKVGGVNEASDA